MKTPKEILALEKVCKEIKTEKIIKENQINKISKIFGPRFTKAMDTIKEKRVKKYVFHPSKRIVWIVVGRERDYQIIPAAGFCSCDDFYYRVMDKETNICYHLIAQKIAEAMEGFDQLDEEDLLYECLMEDWKRVTA